MDGLISIESKVMGGGKKGSMQYEPVIKRPNHHLGPHQIDLNKNACWGSSAPKAPTSQPAQPVQIAHVEQVAHVAQIAQLAHVASIAHIARIAHVARADNTYSARNANRINSAYRAYSADSATTTEGFIDWELILQVAPR